MIPPYHILTHSGRYVNLLEPRPDTITLLDIAHALSNECRFGGHSQRFYSVAQHSVLVSHLVPVEYALEGLLHDAHEAYCKDIPTPLKGVISGVQDSYAAIEGALDAVIRIKYGLPEFMSQAVAEADITALASEAKALMQRGKWLEWFDVPPKTVDIGKVLSHRAAETAFVKRYKQLARVLGVSD